jgi:hypothetical protein
MVEKSNLKVGGTDFFEMLWGFHHIARRRIDDLNRENDVGEVCSTYGGEEKYVQGFGEET